MKETIKRPDMGSEFHTLENCHIVEISNSPDDPGLSIAQARVEPGVTTRWHRLKSTGERYCIISGKGIVEMGNLAEQAVNPGDVVIIPPMCRQRIRNTGSEDLIFLAICTPRFSAENYEDLEERPISNK